MQHRQSVVSLDPAFGIETGRHSVPKLPESQGNYHKCPSGYVLVNFTFDCNLPGFITKKNFGSVHCGFHPILKSLFLFNNVDQGFSKCGIVRLP